MPDITGGEEEKLGEEGKMKGLFHTTTHLPTVLFRLNRAHFLLFTLKFLSFNAAFHDVQ